MSTDVDEGIYVGLMAGTSLDGVDAVAVTFEATGPRMLASLTHPYPAELRRSIGRIDARASLQDVMQLDARVAEAFADAADAVMEAAGLAPGEVRAIGSHGQTVWHHPTPPWPTTVQIGDPNRIAERCGVDVVADFRRRDMAAGGQGAPLAPLFHAGLFGHGEEDRVIVNLGGIANMTRLPAAGPVSGFDTGPANTLMDAWARRHTGAELDVSGTWAASGVVDDGLLGRLRADRFFRQPPPRSTGPEHFNLVWVEAAIGHSRIEPADVQATLAELTAVTVAEAITTTLPTARRVVVCGGGVHNAHLMTRLAVHLPGQAVESSAAHGVDPDAVEALGFAWLARERLAGRTAPIGPVSGARRDTVLGGVYSGA